jgi:hypothetical protein
VVYSFLEGLGKGWAVNGPEPPKWGEG